MFFGNVNMSSLDPSFDLAPKSLNTINVMDSFDIFFRSMLNRAMIVAELIQMIVRPEFIHANRASFCYVIFNVSVKRIHRAIRDYFSHNVAIPLNHSEKKRFCLRPHDHEYQDGDRLSSFRRLQPNFLILQNGLVGNKKILSTTPP